MIRASASMHKPFYALFCLASATILSAPTCVAQISVTNTALSLTNVIETARAKYPAIRAAQAQQKAAQGAVGVARTAYLPRTDLLWQTNRATANNIYGLLLPQGIVPSISGPVLSVDNTRGAWSSAGGVLLSWQPFDFGLRRAEVNSAQQGAAAA